MGKGFPRENSGSMTVGGAFEGCVCCEEADVVKEEGVIETPDCEAGFLLFKLNSTGVASGEATKGTVKKLKPISVQKYTYG